MEAMSGHSTRVPSTEQLALAVWSPPLQNWLTQPCNLIWHVAVSRWHSLCRLDCRQRKMGRLKKTHYLVNVLIAMILGAGCTNVAPHRAIQTSTPAGARFVQGNGFDLHHFRAAANLDLPWIKRWRHHKYVKWRVRFRNAGDVTGTPHPACTIPIAHHRYRLHVVRAVPIPPHSAGSVWFVAQLPPTVRNNEISDGETPECAPS
jgi:hypothetical protein